MPHTDSDLRLRGLPACLRPQPGTTAAPRWALVMDGERDLARRPFDFRNPFPLASAKTVAGLEANGLAGLRQGSRWPLADETDTADEADYYLNSHAALGLPDAGECALVDALGTLRGLAGAWGFALGATAVAADLRRRRRAHPLRPDLVASCRQDGLTWTWRWTAVPAPELSARPWSLAGPSNCRHPEQARQRNLLLRVEIEVVNDGARQAEARLRLAWQMAAGLCAGAFYSGRFTEAPVAPAWQRGLLVAAGGLALGRLVASGWHSAPASAGLGHWPCPLHGTPEGPGEIAIDLHRRLRPGMRAMLRLDVPLLPAAAKELRRASAGGTVDAQRRAAAVWRRRQAGRTRIKLPEAKVAGAFQAALDHLDLMSVASGGSLYPTPGPSGGHHVFYNRDSPEMILAWDLVGEHRRAERAFAHYDLQSLDTEGAGMLLWGLGEHHALAGDDGFARRCLPLLRSAAAGLIDRWTHEQAANGGLFAAYSVCDNELAQGRYVSHHLHAVAGLRAAAKLAKIAGEVKLAASWSTVHRQLERNVRRELHALGRRSAGVVMPTFEGHEAEPVSVDITWETPPRQVAPTGAYGPRGGIDWQNLGVVWPFALLPPHHPLVDSSLDRWRHAYVEGAYTYPRDSDYGQLHNYNGMCLSGTWLRRGDWAETVRDLYGTLLHTSSSHASAEVCDSRGRWDYGCTPHNWFSGRYVRFMRDCLVHEDGGTLRLLAGLSPAWMSPGAEIAVEDLPTALGPLSLRVCFRADGLDLTADWRRRPAAQALVLHLPPFLSGVKALGARRVAGGWRVPVVNGRLRVAWTPAPLPDLSFARVLAAWQSDHRRRRAVLGGAP